MIGQQGSPKPKDQPKIYVVRPILSDPEMPRIRLAILRPQDLIDTLFPSIIRAMKKRKAGENGNYWFGVIAILVSVVCAQAQPIAPAPYHPPAPVENQAPQQKAALVASQIAASAPLTVTLGNWNALGPAPTFNAQVSIPPNNPVCGAIQTVAAHPTNPDILYIGAVNGGIWRTTNATAANPDWTPLTDFLPSLSIGALEFDPTDLTHQTLIAGSARLSSFAGEGGKRIGVLISTDGGNTWTVLGSATLAGQDITSVAARGNVLLAAADSVWTRGNAGGGGLFRSTNSGTSFTLISGSALTGLPAGSISDLVGDPGNPNRFYAAVVTNGIYRSDNLGATWIDVTKGITDISDVTVKIEMAIHNSSAGNAVYVGVINNTLIVTNDYELGGLYRSDNAGVSWTLLDVPQTHLSPEGGQGDLHFSIAADPNSNTVVYVGGDTTAFPPFTGNLFRGDASRPSGTQFETIMDVTAPHADSREMVFDANGNLIETDDGGIYRRSLPQSNLGVWSSVTGNLAAMEAHDVAYDSVAGVAMIGTQDNGTQIQSSHGSKVWRMVQGGDGGDVAIDDTTVPGRSIRYGSSQFLSGFFRDTYDANNNRVSHASPGPTGLADLPQFVTPIKLNKTDPRRLVIATASAVYESLDQGGTVSAVGPGLEVRPPALAYGGWFADVPHPDVLYYGAESTVFLHATNGGPAVPTEAPFPGAKVQGIVLDLKDWHRAFVIDSSRVYVTPDAGTEIWTDITGNLTGVGKLRCLEFFPFGCSYVLAVGTDTGVYVCQDDDLGNWYKLGAGLPNAPVYDMTFNPRAHLLAVGTLGRGAWSFDVPTSSPRISMLDVFLDDVRLGSTNTAYLEICSSCTQDLIVQNVTSSDPQFRVLPPAGGFPLVIPADSCVSLAVEFAPASEGDQTTTFIVTSNDPLAPTARVDGLSRGVQTRVAILGAEEDPLMADVEAKIVASGLFSASQVTLLPVATGAPVPTLAELEAYDAVLVFSNLRFNDPQALGDVLADYLDSGHGRGVVVSTHSFSTDGVSGLGGRIVSGGYLPLGQGSPQFSSHLTLVKDLPGHALLQDISRFDGGLGSTRDGVTLAAGATLVAHWSGGTPLIATSESADRRVVGLNFWPPSTDADLYGWEADTDGGRLMANALLWAGHQARNPASHILVFSASATRDFSAALTNLGLAFQFFGPKDSSAFADAVAAADPPRTLVIAESLLETNALAGLASFVNAGGRAILDYLALQAAEPLFPSDLDSASQVFAGSPPSTVIIYDLGNSSLFDNLDSPLEFTPGAANHGSILFPEPGTDAQALAGFTSGGFGPAVVLSRSAHVLVNGFLLVDVATDLAPRETAVRLAMNEIGLLTGRGGGPLPAIDSQPEDAITAVGGAATFSVIASGSGPLIYVWLRDGVPIAGAMDATYSLTNAQLGDSGSHFSCLVSNAFGSVLSAYAILTVLPPGGESGVINFDEVAAPATFPQTTRLTDRYRAQGVTFAGPGGLDGGAILSENSLFAVTGYSGRNVLAFNTNGRLSDSGMPRGPETISFATPMAMVSMQAGTGLNPGQSLTLAAYDASNTLLASSSIVLSAHMTPVQVTASGIQSVVVSTPSPTLVLDDLAFVPVSAQPQIMAASIRRLPGGQCGFAVSGRIGAHYEIQFSTDMRTWTPLTTLRMTNTTAEFMDVNTNSVRRFYRASLKLTP